MASRGTQQQVSTERLPYLLRELYAGRLLLPATGQPSWEEERRLKLFESLYRGLPIGSITVWRTAEHLDHQRAIGAVPIQEPDESAEGERTRAYLIDGLGRVSTLFEEFGPNFWRSDRSDRRRPLVAAQGRRSTVVFELRTRTFRMRRPEESTRPTEFAMADLFDAERQHEFSARLRALPEGERLANLLAHLVDRFFDFTLPVITLVSDDVEGIRSLLATQRDVVLAAMLDRGPKTTRWYCDVCGQAIEHPEDGGVEWLTRLGDEAVSSWGLRLVHTASAGPFPQGCGYDQGRESQRDESVVVLGFPLVEMIEPDGLPMLLYLLTPEMNPQSQVIEMIQRLHTPGYERARFHLPEALARGIIKDRIETAPSTQEEIVATLEWADREGRKP